MKRSPDQLEFDFRKPAEIVQLPVSIWGRTVWRELADAFADHMMREPDRDEFWWRGLVHQVGQDMRELGLSDGEAMAEVRRAAQYVAQQIAMRRHASRRTAIAKC